MGLQPVTIGGLDTIEDIRSAIRDIAAWTDQLVSDDAPSGDAQVLMRGPDGLIRQYTLVSGGGCTININETNLTITVSVP